MSRIKLIDGERCRQCGKCGEYWPDTSEFFYWNKDHTDFRSPCKACIQEKRYATNKVRLCCVPGCTNPRYPCKNGLYRSSRCWEHAYRREVDGKQVWVARKAGSERR